MVNNLAQNCQIRGINGMIIAISGKTKRHDRKIEIIYHMYHMHTDIYTELQVGLVDTVMVPVHR